MVKKIMSGKIYNADTATLVHDFEYRGGSGYQGMYQTRQGAFFLWRYEDSDGDITPMTDAEAQAWLERHANCLVEQYFGDFPEGGASERRLTIRLPGNLVSRLEALAERKGLSLNSYLMRCVERCAATEGRPGGG